MHFNQKLKNKFWCLWHDATTRCIEFIHTYVETGVFFYKKIQNKVSLNILTSFKFVHTPMLRAYKITLTFNSLCMTKTELNSPKQVESVICIQIYITFTKRRKSIWNRTSRREKNETKKSVAESRKKLRIKSEWKFVLRKSEHQR